MAALVVMLLVPAESYAAPGTPAQFKMAGLHYDEAKAFYSKLRKAVMGGDRKAVAKALEYPFATEVKGKVVDFKNEQEFIADYDSVITKKVTDSLNRSSFDDLILQPEGAMTMDGSVWIGGTRIRGKHGSVYVIRVIAINN